MRKYQCFFNNSAGQSVPIKGYTYTEKGRGKCTSNVAILSQSNASPSIGSEGGGDIQCGIEERCEVRLPTDGAQLFVRCLLVCPAAFAAEIAGAG